MPNNSQYWLQKLPREGDSGTLKSQIHGTFLNAYVPHFFSNTLNLIIPNPNVPSLRKPINFGPTSLVEFTLAGAVLTGPRVGEPTQVQLRPTGHLGDLLKIAFQRHANNAGPFGRFDGDLGLEGGRNDPNGRPRLFFWDRLGAGGMVKGRLRQIRDGDEDGLTGAGLGLSGVEGEEDGLEAGEGRTGGGGDNAREVEAGEEGDEGEGDETEVVVGGLESVVEPLAERVGSGAGERGRQDGG